MAINKINSKSIEDLQISADDLASGSISTAKLADGNVTSAKLSYPLTTFSSTGIDDNASSTAITIDSGEKVGINTTTIPEVLTVNKSSDGAITGLSINNDYPTSSTASAGTGSGIRFGVNDGSFTSAFGDARGSEILSVTQASNGRTRDIVFKTDNGGTLGEKMRILASGGITFNGDTAAANALDDYEEGTWTPAAYAGVSSFTVGQNTYTKIGRSVTIYAELSSFVSKTGSALQISGLPFTPSSGSLYMQGTAESDSGAMGIVRTSAATGRLTFFYGTTSRTTYLGTDLGGGLRFSLTYFTDA